MATTRRGFLGQAAALIGAVATVDLSAVEQQLAAEEAVPAVAVATGGYFVPPIWLVDEYVPYLRAHQW